MTSERPPLPPPSLVVTAWLALATTTVLIPFAGVQLPGAVSFMPALVFAVAAFDAVSIYLLITGYRDRGDVRLLLMAAAFAWSLVVMTGYAFAFPGAITSEPLLDTSSSTMAYLYLGWHVGFALLLGIAAAPWPRRLPSVVPEHRRTLTARCVMWLFLLTALGAVVFAVLDASVLPPLVRASDSHLTRVSAPVVLPVVLLALAASWLGCRRRPGPNSWTTLAILVCLCEVLLTYVSGSRYSLGWYGGRVLTVVAAGVVVFAMLSSVRRIATQAQHHADHDALTGLANRRRAFEELDRRVARAHLDRQPLSVVSLDLDHFKSINDRYGHETGDLVLQAVAGALTRTSRAADLVARMGGEEFLVLLPATGQDGALVAADHLRQAVSSLVLPQLDHGVTASLGTATLLGSDADTFDLLRRADEALYAAKEAGRDRTVVAAPSQRRPVPRTADVTTLVFPTQRH
jgi:diguanylate cyclase (GGDEF)-like protein